MPAFLPDPGLELPTGARSIRRVVPAEVGLIRHDRATDRRIVLAGRRAMVEAEGLGGVASISADGIPLLGAVVVAGPVAANVVSTPRSLTRERIGAGVAFHETVLVPERLPGAVIQWVADSAIDRLTLEVRLPATSSAGAGRYRAEGGMLRWTTSPDQSGGVVQLCGGSDGGWAVVEHSGAWWGHISFDLEADAPITLLAVAISDPDRLPSLPALAAVGAHRRRDDLEPADAPGLRLETGVPDLDDGVGWARAALRAGLTEVGGTVGLRGSAAPWLAAAALTGGERDLARALLVHSPPSVADAEARARWMAWTGEPRPLLDARPDLDAILGEAPQAVRARVADAAEAAGDEEWAAALRTAVARDGGRRLPTLARPATGAAQGDDRQGSAQEAVAAFDGGAPESVEQLRSAVAALRSPEPEAALALLRSALTWMRRGASGADGEIAGATLQLLVEGLLGIDPDAAYGRIKVSPCLPESWDSFHVRGLSVGDAVVDMEMTREDRAYRFALRQRAGGAPVTWIFAPRLPGTGIARIRVDGEDAMVDSRPVGRRIEPRIQIPAERERLVEIELTSP